MVLNSNEITIKIEEKQEEDNEDDNDEEEEIIIEYIFENQRQLDNCDDDDNDNDNGKWGKEYLSTITDPEPFIPDEPLNDDELPIGWEWIHDWKIDFNWYPNKNKKNKNNDNDGWLYGVSFDDFNNAEFFNDIDNNDIDNNDIDNNDIDNDIDNDNEKQVLVNETLISSIYRPDIHRIKRRRWIRTKRKIKLPMEEDVCIDGSKGKGKGKGKGKTLSSLSNNLIDIQQQQTTETKTTTTTDVITIVIHDEMIRMKIKENEKQLTFRMCIMKKIQKNLKCNQIYRERVKGLKNAYYCHDNNNNNNNNDNNNEYIDIDNDIISNYLTYDSSHDNGGGKPPKFIAIIECYLILSPGNCGFLLENDSNNNNNNNDTGKTDTTTTTTNTTATDQTGGETTIIMGNGGTGGTYIKGMKKDDEYNSNSNINSNSNNQQEYLDVLTIGSYLIGIQCMGSYENFINVKASHMIAFYLLKYQLEQRTIVFVKNAQQLHDIRYIVNNQSNNNSNNKKNNNNSTSTSTSTSLRRTPSTTISRDIVMSPYFVRLTISSANDLMKGDLFTSDPYVKISISTGDVFKTTVRRNTLSPKWNESFSIPIWNLHSKLTFDIYDSDGLGDVYDDENDDFLGYSELKVKDIIEINNNNNNNNNNEEEEEEEKEYILTIKEGTGNLIVKASLTTLMHFHQPILKADNYNYYIEMKDQDPDKEQQNKISMKKKKCIQNYLQSKAQDIKTAYDYGIINRHVFEKLIIQNKYNKDLDSRVITDILHDFNTFYAIKLDKENDKEDKKKNNLDLDLDKSNNSRWLEYLDNYEMSNLIAYPKSMVLKEVKKAIYSTSLTELFGYTYIQNLTGISALCNGLMIAHASQHLSLEEKVYELTECSNYFTLFTSDEKRYRVVIENTIEYWNWIHLLVICLSGETKKEKVEKFGIITLITESDNVLEHTTMLLTGKHMAISFILGSGGSRKTIALQDLKRFAFGQNSPRPKKYLFQLNVKSANIKETFVSRDIDGKIYPYCEVEIGDEKFSTSCFPSSQPVWNKMFSFALDQDELDNLNFKLDLKCTKIVEANPTILQKVVKLNDIQLDKLHKDKVSSNTLNSQLLEIVIHKAQNLRSADWNGYSDPYVSIAPIDKKGEVLKKEKQKTSTKMRTLNPVFEERFVFGRQSAIEQYSQIRLRVKDFDFLDPPDALGHIFIDVKDVTTVEKTITVKLEDTPNGSVERNAKDGFITISYKLIEEKVITDIKENEDADFDVSLEYKLNQIDNGGISWPSKALCEGFDISEFNVFFLFDYLYLQSTPREVESSHPIYPFLKEKDGIISVEIWENQRYSPFNGWGNMYPGHLLPSDPGKFTDEIFRQNWNEKGHPCDDDFPLLQGHQWDSDWVLDNNKEDGWLYNIDFYKPHDKFSKKWGPKTSGSFVRRRKYFRVMKTVESKTKMQRKSELRKKSMKTTVKASDSAEKKDDSREFDNPLLIDNKSKKAIDMYKNEIGVFAKTVEGENISDDGIIKISMARITEIIPLSSSILSLKINLKPSEVSQSIFKSLHEKKSLQMINGFVSVQLVIGPCFSFDFANALMEKLEILHFYQTISQAYKDINSIETEKNGYVTLERCAIEIHNTLHLCQKQDAITDNANFIGDDLFRQKIQMYLKFRIVRLQTYLACISHDIKDNHVCKQLIHKKDVITIMKESFSERIGHFQENMGEEFFQDISSSTVLVYSANKAMQEAVMKVLLVVDQKDLFSFLSTTINEFYRVIIGALSWHCQLVIKESRKTHGKNLSNSKDEIEELYQFMFSILRLDTIVIDSLEPLLSLYGIKVSDKLRITNNLKIDILLGHIASFITTEMIYYFKNMLSNRMNNEKNPLLPSDKRGFWIVEMNNDDQPFSLWPEESIRILKNYADAVNIKMKGRVILPKTVIGACMTSLSWLSTTLKREILKFNTELSLSREMKEEEDTNTNTNDANANAIENEFDLFLIGIINDVTRFNSTSLDEIQSVFRDHLDLISSKTEQMKIKYAGLALECVQILCKRFIKLFSPLLSNCIYDESLTNAADYRNAIEDICQDIEDFLHFCKRSLQSNYWYMKVFSIIVEEITTNYLHIISEMNNDNNNKKKKTKTKKNSDETEKKCEHTMEQFLITRDVLEGCLKNIERKGPWERRLLILKHFSTVLTCPIDDLENKVITIIEKNKTGKYIAIKALSFILKLRFKTDEEFKTNVYFMMKLEQEVTLNNYDVKIKKKHTTHDPYCRVFCDTCENSSLNISNSNTISSLSSSNDDTTTESTLQVTIGKGNNFFPKSAIGTGHTYYCILFTKNEHQIFEEKRTGKQMTEKRKNIAPRWNQHFEFVYDENANLELFIQVFEKHTFTKDVLLGTTTVKLEGLDPITGGIPEINGFFTLSPEHSKFSGKLHLNTYIDYKVISL